jgi:hypothetical protein
MLTQVPQSRHNEEELQSPSLYTRMSNTRVEGLVRPILFRDPIGDAEIEALVLARCFSLARARARILRQIKAPGEP